jgi:hypothetical protein
MNHDDIEAGGVTSRYVVGRLTESESANRPISSIASDAWMSSRPKPHCAMASG